MPEALIDKILEVLPALAPDSVETRLEVALRIAAVLEPEASCVGCGYSGPSIDCPLHGQCASYGHPCHCGARGGS